MNKEFFGVVAVVGIAAFFWFALLHIEPTDSKSLTELRIENTKLGIEIAKRRLAGKDCGYAGS